MFLYVQTDEKAMRSTCMNTECYVKAIWGVEVPETKWGMSMGVKTHLGLYRTSNTSSGANGLMGKKSTRHPASGLSDGERNRTGNKKRAQIGRVLHTWAVSTAQTQSGNSWGVNRKCVYGCVCVCALFGLCASCARLEEMEPGVCVCVKAVISPVLSGSYATHNAAWKNVVASSLYAAHHPSIRHIQAVNTHLSNSAPCAYTIYTQR